MSVLLWQCILAACGQIMFLYSRITAALFFVACLISSTDLRRHNYSTSEEMLNPLLFVTRVTMFMPEMCPSPVSFKNANFKLYKKQTFVILSKVTVRPFLIYGSYICNIARPTDIKAIHFYCLYWSLQRTITLNLKWEVPLT